MTIEKLFTILWMVVMLVLLLIRRAHYGGYSAAGKQTAVDLPGQMRLTFLMSLGYLYIPLFFALLGLWDNSFAQGISSLLGVKLPVYLRLAGLGSLGLSVLLFFLVHREMKTNWSPYLELNNEHKLITSGPFAIVRHPMYTSFLLTVLGHGLMLSNWFVLLSGIVTFWIFFRCRIDAEEKMLADFFGAEYTAYRQKTRKKLIPFIY